MRASASSVGAVPDGEVLLLRQPAYLVSFCMSPPMVGFYCDVEMKVSCSENPELPKSSLFIPLAMKFPLYARCSEVSSLYPLQQTFLFMPLAMKFPLYTPHSEVPTLCPWQ